MIELVDSVLVLTPKSRLCIFLPTISYDREMAGRRGKQYTMLLNYYSYYRVLHRFCGGCAVVLFG